MNKEPYPQPDKDTDTTGEIAAVNAIEKNLLGSFIIRTTEHYPGRDLEIEEQED